MDHTEYKRGEIYLNKKRPEPKHMFVVACNKIAGVVAEPDRVLDVGGAAGDFAAYAAEHFPNTIASVLEYDAALVDQGRDAFPDIEFYVGDANDMHVISDRSCTATTMLGVHSVFDDFRPCFEECIRVTQDGGVIVVIDIFNEHPVDALIYWRHADKTESDYTRGHNLFSKASISKFLESHERVLGHTFEPFMVPFDLHKQDDPMRSWTEVGADGTKRFMDGLMPLNIQVLTIKTGA